MKRTVFCLLLSFCVLWSIAPLRSDDCDIDFDFCDSPEVADIINNTSWNLERSCDKFNAYNMLFDFDENLALFKTNVFARSNNINSRSLLDYPEFLPWRHDQDKRGSNVTLFYNQTSRCYFTSDSTNICSYLAITEDEFITALRNVLNQAKVFKSDLDPEKIIAILDLIKPFTISERRFGTMLFGKEKFGRWHAQAWLPFYWLERNHFVTPDVQTEIENAVAELTGVPVSQVDEHETKKFQDAHFISDKLGFGDTRFMIDHPVFKTNYWTMRVGGLITIPTAIAVSKGLRGSSFCRLTYPPILDLCDLINTAIDNPAQLNLAESQAATYALSTLDNLNAILLDSPLGNGGHLELGLYMKNKAPLSKYMSNRWCRNFVWRSFMSVQYLLPAWEQRSYVIPVDLEAFDARNLTPQLDDTQGRLVATENFDFLLEQLNQRLFPVALNTKVHPGFIFHMCSNLSYETKRGGAAVGTDTWLRSGETFSNIQVIPPLRGKINVENAQAPFAFQSKIYGSVFFKKKQPGRVWAVGLTGDYTYWSKGIGQDFSLMFVADVTF